MRAAPRSSPHARREFMVTLLVVLVTTGVAGFHQAADFGLLTDDWPFIGRLVWAEHPGQVMVDRCFGFEHRPLRLVDSALIWVSFQVFGMAGPFLLAWLVISAIGVLFARLARRRWPQLPCLAVGLGLALCAPDTSYLWLVILVARFGMLCVLLAIWAFTRERYLWSGVLLLCGLWGYELAIFAFVLAPWFADGGSRRSLIRTGIVAVAAVAVYSAVRFGLKPEGDARRLSLSTHSLGDLVVGACEAVGDLPRLVFVAWPSNLFSVGWEPGVRWASVAGVVVILGATLALRRFQRPASGDSPFRPDLKAGVFCVLGLMATCSLGSLRGPTDALDTTSRANYLFAPALTLLVAWILLTGAARLGRWGPLVATLVAAVLLGTGVGFRLRVQNDYAVAARVQCEAIDRLVTAAGPIPAETLLIMRIPPEEARGNSARALLKGYNWDLHHAMRLIYRDERVSGLAIRDFADLELFMSTQATMEEAHRMGIGVPPAPTRNVFLLDLTSGKSTWLRPAEGLPKGPRITPGGPALAFVRSRR